MLQSAINRLEIIIIIKISQPFHRQRRGEPEVTSRLLLSCAAGRCFHASVAATAAAAGKLPSSDKNKQTEKTQRN